MDGAEGGKKKKVIIDVDTGIDDAHALLLALRSPLLEVVGVTTVCGNVDVEQVTKNTLQVMDAAHAPLHIPVAKGCSRPLIEVHHFCPEIHGPDGLGGLSTDSPSSRPISPLHAVNWLISTLKSSTHPITIILLAPMTNLAMALRLDPTIKDNIEKVVFMGGSAFSGGNSTQWAEANLYCDPEAAQIVLSAGLRCVMYGWDVYLKMEYTQTDIDLFLASNNEWARFSGSLWEFEKRHFGLEKVGVGDAGAVAAVIHPEGLITKPMHIVVELQGTHTRGMTVADIRPFAFPPDKPQEPPNVEVAVDLDVPTFKKLFMDTLLN